MKRCERERERESVCVCVCVCVCVTVSAHAHAWGSWGEEAWKLTLPAHTPFATTRASSNHICNSKNAEGSYSIFAPTTFLTLSYKALLALRVAGNSSGVKWGSAATTIVAINKWMNQNEPAIHPWEASILFPTIIYVSQQPYIYIYIYIYLNCFTFWCVCTHYKHTCIYTKRSIVPCIHTHPIPLKYFFSIIISMKRQTAFTKLDTLATSSQRPFILHTQHI